MRPAKPTCLATPVSVLPQHVLLVGVRERKLNFIHTVCSILEGQTHGDGCSTLAGQPFLLSGFNKHINACTWNKVKVFPPLFILSLYCRGDLFHSLRNFFFTHYSLLRGQTSGGSSILMMSYSNSPLRATCACVHVCVCVYVCVCMCVSVCVSTSACKFEGRSRDKMGCFMCVY